MLALHCALALAPAFPPALAQAEPATAPRAIVQVPLAKLGTYSSPRTEPELAFEELRRRLRESCPDVAISWFERSATFVQGPAARRAIVFVQTGEGRVRVGRDESGYRVGDLLVVEGDEEVRFEPDAGILVFTLPARGGSDLPWIIRPDWDPRITDTPGGCATDDDAYRRILLTWKPEVGPYVDHALNAHRVRITDSFTHYHPVAGGFDEMYLVQDAAPGAHLWIGERLEPFLDPVDAPLGDVPGLLRKVPVAAGDLILIPRGVVHRGVGGILAQVIAVPGFVPGTEIAVDDAIRRLDERLGLDHPLAMPWHGGPPWVEVSPSRSSGSGRDEVSISIDGAPFATAVLGDGPHLHPVLGPGGLRMTRAFPFEEREGEARDHPHHRSLWFAHGAVDGLDFWSGADNLVRTTALGDHSSGVGRGVFTMSDDWLAPDGTVVCRDSRRIEAFAEAGLRGLDVDVTLLAAGRELRLGETKESTMALRLAPGLTVDGSDGRARLVNSEGLEGAGAWGKRARWMLASGAIDGRPAAVVVMDHPSNLRHPTTWQARTYGLLAANPFGLSHFEGAPAGTGDLVLPPDGSLRLRYRVLFLAAVPTAAEVDARFSEFAAR